MPPKLPLTNKLLSTAATPFICPSCRHKKSISTYNGIDGSYNARKSRGFQPQRRSASTTPSVTAVNVKREIPSTYQELYGALKTLESDAGVYVNTSQLQLALRGLEAENAITRIAGEHSCIFDQIQSFAEATNSVGTAWSCWSSQAHKGLASGSIGS